MSVYTRSESPLERADVLSESYQPNEILGRDDEIEQLQTIFQDIIDREPPTNAFLYGLSGLGKTASVRTEVDQLEQDAEQFDDINIESVWLNCDECTSSYQVAIAIANKLLENSQLPKSGLPRGEVYDTMFNELDDLGSDDDSVRDYVAIVLDEVDNIGTKDQILYQIPRARSNNKLNNVFPVLIGISNNPTFRNNLSPKVKSSLCETEITFPQYDANQLREILMHRAELAFVDDAIGEDVVKLCAAFGAREGNGDARYAIDLLRMGARNAKKEDSTVVTEDHVREAQQRIERDRNVEALTATGDHDHMAIAALLYTYLEDDTPVRRRDLYPIYQDFATEILGDSNNVRMLHDYLNNLSMLGLIDQNHVTAGPGKNYFEYDIGDPLTSDMIIDALRQLDVAGYDGTSIPDDLQSVY